MKTYCENCRRDTSETWSDELGRQYCGCCGECHDYQYSDEFIKKQQRKETKKLKENQNENDKK